MEEHGHHEMEGTPLGCHSHIKSSKINREHSVTNIRNTQCSVDNLSENGYFSAEDAEIVCACPTKPDKVRKILDSVQSKGEEVSEFFLYVSQQSEDAYVDLRSWLSEIGFSPSQLIRTKTIVNTDPVSRYTQQSRHQSGRDSKFMSCYAQKEDSSSEETYMDTLMESVGFNNENSGSLGGSDCSSDHSTGVLNEHGETVFVFGDAGVGKSMSSQRLQSLWASGRLTSTAKFFFHFRCRMFSCFKESDMSSSQDSLFKHFCYPEQDPEEVFSFLSRFPHTALFTFDGSDESHSDFDSSRVPDSCCPWEPAHPSVSSANLLSGRSLKGAGKLLTARTGVEVPRQLSRKKVSLRGFSPSHSRAYARRMFPERTAQEHSSQQSDANPNLCSSCGVPLFCWIIFRCFQHFQTVFEGSSSQLPDCAVTSTDVFSSVTEVHSNRPQPSSSVQRNTRSPAETLRAGWRTSHASGEVAHRGTDKSLFVFGQEEVQASKSQEGDSQSGFSRALPDVGPEQGQSYEFFHLTLQAFFTAFFSVADDKVSTRELSRFFREWTSPGEATSSSCHSSFFSFQCSGGRSRLGPDPFRNKDHFQFTNLFSCGLSAKARQKLLRQSVPKAISRRKRKASWAHSFASSRSYLKSLPRVQSGGFNQVHAMPTFSWMSRCIYETQSQKVGRLAARGISADYLKSAFCNACSADCSASSFVSHHFHRQSALDSDNNNLNDYGVQESQPCFSRLTVIRLSVNQITDTGVKVLCEESTKYKIVTFSGLYNNQITDIGARYVAQISDECRGLKHLKLGKNRITSEGGKCVALAVKNSTSIVDVGMWGNQIGDEGAKAFAEALKDHPSSTTLSLAFNGISPEGGKSLAQASKQNTTSTVIWSTKNELNDESAECFAEMSRVNQTLRHLWSIQNRITAKGTAQSARASQKNTAITEICLNGNLIKPEEAKVFENEKRIICF